MLFKIYFKKFRNLVRTGWVPGPVETFVGLCLKTFERIL